jgi:hypothetical protein
MLLLPERASGFQSYARPLDSDNRDPIILVDFDAFALSGTTLCELPNLPDCFPIRENESSSFTVMVVKT